MSRASTCQTSARDVNVTPRAATGTLSDSMLVLLDGRSIYQDFFGVVLWDFLPVDLNEIKQIEVIRGPASAVWGANAMNGVVNVITKTPRELEGTNLVTSDSASSIAPRKERTYDGGGRLFSIDVTHAAATSDRFAYKVSAGFLAQEAYLRPTGAIPRQRHTPIRSSPNEGTSQPRLDARVDYDRADKRRRHRARRRHLRHRGDDPHRPRATRGSARVDIQVRPARRTRTASSRLQTFVNALDGEARAAVLAARSRRAARVQLRRTRCTTSKFSNLHAGADASRGVLRRQLPAQQFRSVVRATGHAAETKAVFTGRTRSSCRTAYRWIVGVPSRRLGRAEEGGVSPRTTLLIKPSPSRRSACRSIARFAHPRSSTATWRPAF